MRRRRDTARPIAAQIQQRVRDLRKSRGLTQEELCERAGISIDAVTRIESGRRSPSLATLERLSQALGVSPAALFDPAAQPPRATNPSPAGRIAALLESEPLDVQKAIERVVRAVLPLARRRR